MVIISGATLAGLAAAARLARLGHEVTLVTHREPLGGTGLPAGPIALPATWRDLFKKSGGHLQTELNRAHLELVPAYPLEVPLSNGAILQLPAERGAQYRAVTAALGEHEAQRWRDLLDELDEVWLRFRRHALEGMAPVTDADRPGLLLNVPIATLAARVHDDLASLVIAAGGAAEAPGIEALPLSIDRMFGRWQLIDAAGQTRPNETLLDLLLARVVERGVLLVDHSEAAVDLDCVAPKPGKRSQSATEWLDRVPIVGRDGTLRASAASLAGPAPWAELGSAALAVYELHERLTGENCRPSNTEFRLPRIS